MMRDVTHVLLPRPQPERVPSADPWLDLWRTFWLDLPLV